MVQTFPSTVVGRLGDCTARCAREWTIAVNTKAKKSYVMRTLAFRVDASTYMGIGHVMRCLALARAVCTDGDSVVFICREHDGNVCDLIEQHGYSVARLPRSVPTDGVKDTGTEVDSLGATWEADAADTIAAIVRLGSAPDWLVVDHYAIDRQWEGAVRAVVRRIMTIDDLGNRVHDCDILLDQNLHDDSQRLYEERLLPGTLRFFGPKYAILRPEFADPSQIRARDGAIDRILVSFGGSDVENQSVTVLRAIAGLSEAPPQTTIVLGPSNPNRDALRDAARGYKWVTVLETTNRMAALMCAADLGIGTCGIAAWERCAIGLPSLVSVDAANQREDARILHARGACRNLGDARTVSEQDWTAAIEQLRSRPRAVARMSAASLAILEGRQQAFSKLVAAIRDD